jgi:LDH2 family malate/lactate/ureidoglycolate dehydrogenase
MRLKEAGRANFSPQLNIIYETPSTATLDADNALGLVSAPFAMDIAIEKAKQAGTGWVSIQNSNHFGIAAYHACKALKHDMIGIALTNASPLVAPTGSKERMLGTNPICYAFPAHLHPPVVIDLATSAAANGKLEIAQREKKQIPKGWLLNKNGIDSNNPSDLSAGGMLLPLGSGEANAGHKGFGLSAMVDLMCGVIGGANYGPWVPPFVSFLNPLPNLPGKGIGHFIGAMRIDAFRPAIDYYTHMDNWINRFKKAIPIDANSPVIIPGEPEYACEQNRKAHGIPLNKEVISDLIKLGDKYGVPFNINT